MSTGVCSHSIKQLIAYLKTHPTAARELATALEQAHNGDENSYDVVDRQATQISSETPREVHVEVGWRGGGASTNRTTECRWLTAVEMGLRVGQSAKWVKERVDLLPPDSVKRGSRQRWLIDERVTDNLMMMR